MKPSQTLISTQGLSSQISSGATALANGATQVCNLTETEFLSLFYFGGARIGVDIFTKKRLNLLRGDVLERANAINRRVDRFVRCTNIQFRRQLRIQFPAAERIDVYISAANARAVYQLLTQVEKKEKKTSQST